MPKIIIIECKDCNKDVEAKNIRRLFCTDCYKNRNKNNALLRLRNNPAKAKEYVKKYRLKKLKEKQSENYIEPYQIF